MRATEMSEESASYKCLMVCLHGVFAWNSCFRHCILFCTCPWDHVLTLQIKLISIFRLILCLDLEMPLKQCIILSRVICYDCGTLNGIFLSFQNTILRVNLLSLLLFIKNSHNWSFFTFQHRDSRSIVISNDK